jgi:hypothetical protein
MKCSARRSASRSSGGEALAGTTGIEAAEGAIGVVSAAVIVAVVASATVVAMAIASAAEGIARAAGLAETHAVAMIGEGDPAVTSQGRRRGGGSAGGTSGEAVSASPSSGGEDTAGPLLTALGSTSRAGPVIPPRPRATVTQPRLVVPRAFLALVLAIASGASAQSQAVSSHTLRGVAWDSLRSIPLAGAIITLEGTRRIAISDKTGGFAFDSVAAGTHALVMEHDLLDSLDLISVRRVATVPTEGREVLLAVPAFATIWRAACGGAAVPASNGLLFGSVRNAQNHRGIPDATVRVRWTMIRIVNGQAAPTVLGGDATADGGGNYTICGVPSDSDLRIQAVAHGLAGPVITLQPGELRVRRFNISVATASDSSRRGSITGIVRDNTGRRVPGAKVTLSGGGEVETGADGKFTFQDIAMGSHQVTARAIAANPVNKVVEVSGGQVTETQLDLVNFTLLEEARVETRSVKALFAKEMEERKVLGVAKFVDSTEIMKHINVVGAMTKMPALRVMRDGTIAFQNLGGTRDVLPCPAGVMIDKRMTDQAELRMLPLEFIGTLEIYRYSNQIPIALYPNISNARAAKTCGLIAVWTKGNFKQAPR